MSNKEIPTEKSLNEDEYRALALRTKSERFNDNEMSALRLEALVSQFVDIANSIGKAKSELFYETDGQETSENMQLAQKDLDADLVHAIMGIADEAGELASVLLDHISGEEIDRINLIEERGDLEWYTNLLDTNQSLSPGKIRAANIEKLSERFGDKFGDVSFNENSALNRNRNNERKAIQENK